MAANIANSGKGAPENNGGVLPTFIRQFECPDDPSLIVGIDGWRVEPSGDFDLDTVVGEIYADLAIKYAKKIQQPQFVAFVLSSMQHKVAAGAIRPSGIEHGFIGRIAAVAYLGSLN